MSPRNPLFYDERRQGPDLLVRILRWLAVAGWILVIIFLLIAAFAKPEIQSYFGEQYREQYRADWDLAFLRNSYYLMIAVLGISISGCFINLRRHRRRNDEFMVSFFTMGLTALIGILIYLFSFR